MEFTDPRVMEMRQMVMQQRKELMAKTKDDKMP
jgi:hypothetical protein